MTEITVTLRQILNAKPCYDPRDMELLPADHNLDAPISFRKIAEKVNHNDLVWCFANALPSHEALKRHFAVDCAERILHLMTNERSLTALVIARRHALEQATDNELAAARAAASDAVSDAARAARAAARAARAAAWAASDAVSDAAWAARAAASDTASDAASDAARAAAWAASDAVSDAARAAAWAARAAASDTASDAARAAAWAAWAASDAENKWQIARLVQLAEAGEWTPINPLP